MDEKNSGIENQEPKDAPMCWGLLGTSMVLYNLLPSIEPVLPCHNRHGTASCTASCRPEVALDLRFYWRINCLDPLFLWGHLGGMG